MSQYLFSVLFSRALLFPSYFCRFEVRPNPINESYSAMRLLRLIDIVQYVISKYGSSEGFLTASVRNSHRRHGIDKLAHAKELGQVKAKTLMSSSSNPHGGSGNNHDVKSSPLFVSDAGVQTLPGSHRPQKQPLPKTAAAETTPGPKATDPLSDVQEALRTASASHGMPLYRGPDVAYVEQVLAAADAGAELAALQGMPVWRQALQQLQEYHFLMTHTM